MKKPLSLLLIAALFITACKKSSSNEAPPNNLSSLIVGIWTGVKNVTTYTDVSGKTQVYNNGYIYTYNISSDGTASKTWTDPNGEILQVYIRNVPYKITSANGKNYIHFEVVANDTGDTYQIVSLTDHSLILHADVGNFNSGSPNFITGTNAVIDEEYAK